MSALHLRVAARHLHGFEKESHALNEHHDAMDSLDCEAFLQLGIDAYHWLVRADEVNRKGIANGGVDYDPQVEAALETQFRRWIAPCDAAQDWIAKVTGRGYDLQNLAEFRNCELEVRSLIRFLDQDQMNDPMRKMRDDAVSEHASGQTADFVQEGQ